MFVNTYDQLVGHILLNPNFLHFAGILPQFFDFQLFVSFIDDFIWYFLMPLDDTLLTPFIPKKIQLLTIVRNTKPTDFEKKSDGWEVVLKKAQNKGLYPVNKTWLDFYYEIWISNIDDTIVSKWQLMG